MENFDFQRFKFKFHEFNWHCIPSCEAAPRRPMKKALEIRPVLAPRPIYLGCSISNSFWHATKKRKLFKHYSYKLVNKANASRCNLSRQLWHFRQHRRPVKHAKSKNSANKNWSREWARTPGNVAKLSDILMQKIEFRRPKRPCPMCKNVATRFQMFTVKPKPGFSLKLIFIDYRYYRGIV